MASNDASYDVLDLEAAAYAQTQANLGIALDGSVSFSVDAWVKLDGLCSGASILSKRESFAFGISGDQLVLSIAGYPPVQSKPGSLDHLEWHYVTATYASGQVRLYVDGQFNVLQGISGSGIANANPFEIGNGLQAHVTSVRVYNTALSGDAVLTNMFESPAAAAVVASFDFSQTPPRDLGPGKLPITLKAGARMTRSTPGLSLSDTAFAEPLSEGEVDPGGEQVDPYTVQAWVYVSDASQAEQAIFVNSDLESETGMALYLERAEAGKGFQVVSQRGSSMGEDSLVSTALVTPGEWTNVATTFTGTTLSVFVNGEAAGSAPFGPIPLSSEAGRLLVGAALSQSQPFGVMTLQGFVSRLEVWDRALSAAEVATYMAASPDVAAEGLTACYDFTTARARNMLDAHPIGLADGARLVEQVQAASPSTPAPTTRKEPVFSPELDEGTIRSLCEAIDLDELLREPNFEAAMEEDAKAFEGDPEGQERVRAAWREALDQMRADPTSARFLVTSHVLDGEHVVLCHRRGQTHVAFRIGVEDIDECTLWKVKLIFIVVAGMLDAFFGVSAKLERQAIDYIRQILRQPRIAVLLGPGAQMTARAIFTLGGVLYQYGFLKELVTMIAEVGFWALLRVLVKAAIKLTAIGYADVIASLVATAAAFIVEFAKMPPSCSAPQVDLAGIKFDYDPTAAATDALSIRRNYATNVPVVQWTKGMTKPEDSPAAYAISRVSGKVVTLQAGFLMAGEVGSVQVKAEGGGVLGAIDPFTVRFKGGKSDPEYVTISLNHHTLAAGGIQRQDVEWHWSYLPSGSTWIPFATTSHRIYTLLDTPSGPWRQSPSSADKQLPWTDVLDFACQWANGKTTTGDAAAAVTRQVDAAIGLRYDTSTGTSKYTARTGGENVFRGTRFIDFLRGGTGEGPVVNCTDCATIVTTFANSLGCNLFAATMYPPSGSDFSCNMIQAIGSSDWKYPFASGGGGGFSYHEVAWTRAGSYSDPLYDACLKVDGGPNPWDWTAPTDPSHVATLPLSMQFTTRGVAPALPITTPFADSSYRERLATNNASGIGSCEPEGPFPGTQSGRRRVI